MEAEKIIVTPSVSTITGILVWLNKGELTTSKCNVIKTSKNERLYTKDGDRHYHIDRYYPKNRYIVEGVEVEGKNIIKFVED